MKKCSYLHVKMVTLDVHMNLTYFFFQDQLAYLRKMLGKVTILLSNRLPEEFNGTIFDKNKINLSKTI